jgi:hypothetical protein
MSYKGGNMGIADTKRIQEITDRAKELPDSLVQELLDFAEFLRMKKQGFSYRQITDSAEYVRSVRSKEGKKAKSGRAFLKELVEWQESNS